MANYSQEDIDAYYADATVTSSGIQQYDWNSELLSVTRHLDFDGDKHKILETELKQLCECFFTIAPFIGNCHISHL